MMQRVRTLTQPIQSETPGIPLVIQVQGSKSTGLLEGGSGQTVPVTEHYICLSQLPAELRERVRTAVQMMLQV